MRVDACRNLREPISQNEGVEWGLSGEMASYESKVIKFR